MASNMSHHKLIVTIIFILFGAFDCKPSKRTGCNIIIRKLEQKQPIILQKNIDDGFFYPNNDKKDSILLNVGDEIRLACPGSHFGAMPDTYIGTFKCVQNDLFSFNGQNFALHNFLCDDHPYYWLQQDRTKCGSGTGNEGEIGFELDPAHSEYYPLLDFCHDSATHHTHYVHTELKAGVKMIKKKTWTDRKSFVKDDLYKDIPMKEIYETKKQLPTFKEILSDTTLADKYISLDLRENKFLAKGHLIAKGDFLYEPLKRATFYYVNTVPMWQSVNIGNWASVERTIQNYMARTTRDYDVLAGGKEILKLNNTRNQPKEIYLHYADGGQTSYIEVPRLIYKILYNTNLRSGVVFVVINNPYLTQVPTTDYYIICTDVSSKLKADIWKEFVSRRTDLSRGYAYACDVNDFKSKFPANYFPMHLDVQTLLTT